MIIAGVRSALGIALGLAVFFIVVSLGDGFVFALWPSAVTPDHQHVVSRVALWIMAWYWSLGICLGSALTGIIAGRARPAHAAVLGSLLALYFASNAKNAIGTVDPVWWHLMLVALAVPVAMLGVLPWRRAAAGRHANGA